jgi:hypothetical protein
MFFGLLVLLGPADYYKLSIVAALQVALLVGLLSYAGEIYVLRSTTKIRVVFSALVVFNLLILPGLASLAEVWFIPASVGMPCLLFGFWATVFVTIRVIYLTRTRAANRSTFSQFALGFVGVSGIALLITQAGVVAGGVSTYVPVTSLTKQGFPTAVPGDSAFAERFDHGAPYVVPLVDSRYTFTAPYYYKSYEFLSLDKEGQPFDGMKWEPEIVFPSTTYGLVMQALVSFGAWPGSTTMESLKLQQR